MKKDFSAESINTNSVYNEIETATNEPQKNKRKPRKTYTKEEAHEALENLSCAGMKGVKLHRINMAFTPSNYDFIKTMARVQGINQTKFVNVLIEKAREEYADIYKKAIEFQNSI